MIILDTNVWVSFLYNEDSQHKKAVEVFESLDEQIVVPEYIATEVSTVLAQRADIHLAQNFIKRIVSQDEVQILYSSPEYFHATSELFGTLTSAGLSFIDVMLVVLSKSYTVITFDKALQKVIR